MTQKLAGYSLLIAAVFMMLSNIGDAVADLQTWHAATSTAFVGAILKQIGATGMAALGGKLLPSFGGSNE